MAEDLIAPGATPLTFIDLFCGCGGFTLGMQRAGFDCLAAIDFNPEAVATLRANLQEYRAKISSLENRAGRSPQALDPSEQPLADRSAPPG